jgi:hypothetical protein
MIEWLEGLSAWIETTRLHQTVQTVEWVVPTVQTVHLLAIAAVFGSSLVLALRTLRLAGTDWSPAQWQRRLGGWIGLGLVVLLLSGSLLIVGEPGRSLLNFTFQLKMGLLIGAIIVLMPLAGGMKRLDRPDAGAAMSLRLLAVLLILLWLAIIACGRWIAYS